MMYTCVMLLTPLKKLFQNYLSKMKKWEKKHPVLNTLLVLFGIVFLWRGIWGLLDTFLFPNNQPLSYGVCVILGFLILLLDDFELDEI